MKRWAFPIALFSFLAGAAFVECARAIRHRLAPPAPYEFTYRHVAYQERARLGGPNCKILFVGDSITECWGDQALWDQELAPRGAVNLGIPRDTTTDILRRLADGELDGLTPRVVVLMAGTNDFPRGGGGDTPEAVAARVRQVVSLIRSKLPAAKIVLTSILPRSHGGNDKVAATNAILAKTECVTWLDISGRFGTGTDPALMPDGVHLSPAGYRIWLDALRPYLP